MQKLDITALMYWDMNVNVAGINGMSLGLKQNPS